MNGTFSPAYIVLPPTNFRVSGNERQALQASRDAARVLQSVFLTNPKTAVVSAARLLNKCCPESQRRLAVTSFNQQVCLPVYAAIDSSDKKTIVVEMGGSELSHRMNAV